MNENKFTNQQIILYEDVKLGPTAFVNAFSDVDKPSIQFFAGISVLDVISNVIRCEFSDLGMDFISLEIVVLNVTG